VYEIKRAGSGVPRQLYLVQRSPIAFSTVVLKHLCDIFVQYVGIEIAVLMDEEESAAAQKSRLLVFQKSPSCEELPSLATAAGIPRVRWQN
jgi:hypothetical protein